MGRGEHVSTPCILQVVRMVAIYTRNIMSGTEKPTGVTFPAERWQIASGFFHWTRENYLVFK
jgi:hypothetical protein